MIPAGFTLMLLQGIALTLRSFCTVIGHPLEKIGAKEQQEEQQHA